jgi:hypothetical protein
VALKRELEQEIRDLKRELEGLEADKKILRRDLEIAQGYREEAERKLMNLGEVYVASSSPGKPVCYVGTYEDAGLSVNIYRDSAGNVIGVTAWDGTELAGAVGMIPAEEYAAELGLA